MFNSFGEFSDQPALISGSETVSYRELLARGQELAQLIPKRSLILVMTQNVPELVAGYTGFLRAGMVQLLVNETMAPEFLRNLISIYCPAYSFVPESVSVHGDIMRVARGYKLVAMKEAKSCQLHPDLALLLSTSGTTGSPKLVRLSHQNLQANTASIIQYLRIGSGERTITTMPISYSYGLSILNTHLSTGAAIVMTEASIMSREFWDLLKKNSVTSFGGVPYFYEMLKKLKFERMDLPSLRYLTQAGGKIDQNLGAEFVQICLQKNLRLYVMYGQTEATARISYLCATDRPDKIGCIGRAIPNGKLVLEDEQGCVISQPGEVGELIYEGANVSMGTSETQADLALGDMNRGRLRTGDLATRDQDGFYSIVGRKNRFLKIFGLRINLVHLEEVLNARGLECACVGTDQRLFIYVTNIDHPESLEQIIFELTGIHKSGFQLVKIDSLPRTSSGKIHYKALEGLRD